MFYYLLFLFIGIALGAVGVYFAMRAQVQAGKERIAMTEQQKQQEGDSLRQQMRDQQETFRQQMQALQEQQQQQMRDGRESLQQQMRSQQESQRQQMEQQMALLREQMSTTSERVLKERAAELSAVNSEQLSKILNPLQQNLQLMRTQTEKMQKDHDDSLRELKTAIQVNMERERAMGEQTERLAQALTGQNKIQGNFGELKLTQILEQMELERGLQYDTQETMRDEQGRTITSDEGRRMVPDAVLHFPDGRDVIIDSKMSRPRTRTEAVLPLCQERQGKARLRPDVRLSRERPPARSAKRHNTLEGSLRPGRRHLRQSVALHDASCARTHLEADAAGGEPGEDDAMRQHPRGARTALCRALCPRRRNARQDTPQLRRPQHRHSPLRPQHHHRRPQPPQVRRPREQEEEILRLALALRRQRGSRGYMNDIRWVLLINKFSMNYLCLLLSLFGIFASNPLKRSSHKEVGTMNEIEKNNHIVSSASTQSLIQDLRQIVEQARCRVASTANAELTMMYWHIGERINREVLGNQRAEYGKQIVASVARQLQEDFGTKGFDEKNIRRMMQFAQLFPDEQIVAPLARQLSWSHFLMVMPLKDELQQEFYLTMAASENWSKRMLRKEIDGMLFERTAIANKPDELIKNELSTLRDDNVLSPDLVFKSPYFLEFTGLKGMYSERTLEDSLLAHLEQFIVELGNGFTFVARQKRMIIDGEDFYLDLLFYHRRLHRLIAIDLKLGRFKAQYKGQMELYLRWLEQNEMEPGEESPLGLLLCTEGGEEQIELLQLDKAGIKVAQYMTELPPREVLIRQIQKSLEAAKAHFDDNFEKE